MPNKKCEHGKRKSRCVECGGSEICSHRRIKSQCKECGGRHICKEHGKRKAECVECGGASICKEHGKIKSRCVECGGASICKEHGKIKSRCVECGGSSICKEHGKIKSRCVECGGASTCIHKRQRSQCPTCDPLGHLAQVVRCRTKQALKSAKTDRTLDYIGCSIDDFKCHIESQFQDGMAWDNYGDWHIDHIIPLKYKVDSHEPTLEETIQRLHYTNTQPLWATDNIAKGNHRIGR